MIGLWGVAPVYRCLAPGADPGAHAEQIGDAEQHHAQATGSGFLGGDREEQKHHRYLSCSVMKQFLLRLGRKRMPTYRAKVAATGYTYP